MTSPASGVRAVVMVASLVALAACSRDTAPAPAPRTAAVGERLPLQWQQVEDLRVVAGTYTAHDLVDARARTPGTVMSLAVKAGDSVRRGQVLAVVADERLRLEAESARAQAGAAAAESNRAAAELLRTRDLFSHGVYAKARLEQVEALAQGAQDQATAAAARRDAAAAMVAQGAVLAPADGVVLQAAVPVGSVVAPGQAVLQVTAGPRVIRLQLPEAQAGLLTAGQMLQCRDVDGKPASCGPVLQVYPASEAGQVTVDLQANVTGRFIGAQLQVLAPVARRRALQVPERFVTRRYGVDTVRVLAADGGADPVVVQVGPAAAGLVELLSGVTAGDTLVAGGAAP